MRNLLLIAVFMAAGFIGCNDTTGSDDSVVVGFYGERLETFEVVEGGVVVFYREDIQPDEYTSFAVDTSAAQFLADGVPVSLKGSATTGLFREVFDAL